MERLVLLNEIKKSSEEDTKKQIEYLQQQNATKEYLRSTIMQESKRKEMLQKSEKKEAKQAMRNQIKHFDDAEK